MKEKSYVDTCDESTLICTGILPRSMMPGRISADSKTVLVYNPGTERTPTIIRLAGDVGEGLLIRNHTTEQRCRIRG